jgi:hypothetical protein
MSDTQKHDEHDDERPLYRSDDAARTADEKPAEQPADKPSSDGRTDGLADGTLRCDISVCGPDGNFTDVFAV